jgi:uncharacterized protein (TIGR02118 family)
VAAQVLALYNEPADPTHFEQYYYGTHVPLAKRIPGLRKYTVSKGPVAAQGGAEYYLVAILEFDSMEAIQAALASPEGQQTAGDLPNFATGGVSLLVYEIHTV